MHKNERCMEEAKIIHCNMMDLIANLLNKQTDVKFKAYAWNTSQLIDYIMYENDYNRRLMIKCAPIYSNITSELISLGKDDNGNIVTEEQYKHNFDIVNKEKKIKDLNTLVLLFDTSFRDLAQSFDIPVENIIYCINNQACEKHGEPTL